MEADLVHPSLDSQHPHSPDKERDFGSVALHSVIFRLIIKGEYTCLWFLRPLLRIG